MEPSSHQPTAVGTALVHVSNAFFELLDYDGDTSLLADPGGHHHVPVDVVVRPPGGQRPQHREVVPAQDSRIAARVHARSVPQRGLH
jgi:hypothetical protein